MSIRSLVKAVAPRMSLSLGVLWASACLAQAPAAPAPVAPPAPAVPMAPTAPAAGAAPVQLTAAEAFRERLLNESARSREIEIMESNLKAAQANAENTNLADNIRVQARVDIAAFRQELRDKVLASPDTTLGQKYRAKAALGEDGTFTSTTYAIGAWFERNFDRIDVNIFQPKARIYFDDGEDEDGEVDIFQDGALVPTIEVAEIRFLNYVSSSRKTAAGLAFSAGIGVPATTEDTDGTSSTSSAPVLLTSAGFLIAHQLDDVDPKQSSAIVGMEIGYSFGVTADEDFADSNDGAIYVGFGVQIKF